MSMPRVGSSTIRIFGSSASQRASTTFCWLPPERFRTICSGLAMRIRGVLEALDQLALRAARRRSRTSAEAAERGHATGCCGRPGEEQRLLLAVLGHEADAVPNRVAGERIADRRAVDRTLPRSDRSAPKMAAGDLGPARAHQPGDADDLAGAHATGRDVARARRRADRRVPRRAEPAISSTTGPGVARLGGGEQLRHRAPDHHAG